VRPAHGEKGLEVQSEHQAKCQKSRRKDSGAEKQMNVHGPQAILWWGTMQIDYNTITAR